MIFQLALHFLYSALQALLRNMHGQQFDQDVSCRHGIPHIISYLLLACLVSLNQMAYISLFLLGMNIKFSEPIISIYCAA